MATQTNIADQAFDRILIALLVLVPLVITFEFNLIAYYPKLLALHTGLALLYLIWTLNKTPRPIFCASALTLPILCYLALCTLSFFQAVNRVEATVQLAHRVVFPLLFFAVINNVRPQAITRYVRYATGIGIAISLIGLIQYAGWGLHWIPSAGFPSGTLGYRNYAAMYTLLCIPLGVMLFIETHKPTAAWLWGLGTALLITFLFCTRARGAWVGLAVGLLATGLSLLWIKTHDGQPLWKSILPSLTHQHLSPVLTGLVIALAFLILVPPNMQGRGFDRNRPDKNRIVSSLTSIIDPSNDESKSVQYRLDMWRNSLDLIVDHPVLGVGPGNWQFIYPAYDGGDVVWEGASPRRPHNDYIWIAAELGLPGLTVYVWLLAVLFWCIFRQLRTQNRSRIAVPIAIGAALLALATNALFSFPNERIAVSTLSWFLIACIAVLDAENRPRTSHRTWSRLRLGGLAVLALCVIIDMRALAFDRHFARAVKSVQQKDWTQVTREATTALQYGVFAPQALLLRGVGHAHLGNFEQAVRDNDRCLDYHPNLLNALNNMGLLYNNLKQYQKAHDVLRRALEIDPEHADAHANLGIAHQGLGQLETSVTHLERALALAPGNADVRTYLAKAHYSLAEARRTQGDTTGAIAAYTAFLNIWQGDPKSAATVRAKLQTLTTETQ